MNPSVLRYDFAPITRSEITDEGYLRVWCHAARTGTQIYRRADGSQVREYRPPEEVSDPDSLGTFGMKPATWGHPPVLLDAKNTNQYQVGYSGSQVRFTDGFVEVALVVTDKDAIERIQRKDATQVSAGYRVDFDPSPGITPEGESYDGVQRKIRVNHIAIVPQGRAGPNVRLLLDHMDAADAVAVSEEDPAPKHKSPASPLMATVNLDGLEIELPAEAATAVQSFVKDMTRQVAAVTNERDSLQSKLDSVQEEIIDDLVYQKDTAEQTAQTLQARVDELEAAEPGEPRLDQAQIDALVTQRLELLRHLAPALDESYKFDGVDSDTIYKDAFLSLTGNEPPEDAPMAYIAGAVDGILGSRSDEEPDKEPQPSSSTSKLRESVAGVKPAHSRNDAQEQHRTKLESAWKQPLTATK